MAGTEPWQGLVVVPVIVHDGMIYSYSLIGIYPGLFPVLPCFWREFPSWRHFPNDAFLLGACTLVAVGATDRFRDWIGAGAGKELADTRS
jgi:hypothetical protein